MVISLLLISAFVVILNETIMGVALPRLMASLNVTASAAQWLTTAFLLTMAVVIPITGFMLQRMNTRPIFIIAMSLFSLGTLMALRVLAPLGRQFFRHEETTSQPTSDALVLRGWDPGGKPFANCYSAGGQRTGSRSRLP